MAWAGSPRTHRMIRTVQEVCVRCELPRHKTEQCSMMELEKARLSGHKVSWVKGKKKGAAAKEVDADFLDEDDDSSNQSDGTEVGFMMCDNTVMKGNGGGQEEHDGTRLMK